MRITTTYDRVKATAKREVTCPGCHGKRTIQRTFYQTVNPFNKNEDGTIKTYRQVWRSVTDEAKAWVPEGISLWHDKCWGKW